MMVACCVAVRRRSPTCNLVRALVEGDYADFILCHAKETLIKGGKDSGLTDLRTSWSKAKLIKYFLANVTFKTAHDHCKGRSFPISAPPGLLDPRATRCPQ